MIGDEWTAPMPPRYIWGAPPEGCRYVPYRDATICAVAMAARTFGGARIRAIL
jgi:hypothetical protein